MKRGLKKLMILLVFSIGLFLPFTGFANTTLWPWSPTSWAMECPSEIAVDGRVKYGVPVANNSAAPSSGTTSCATHFYDLNSIRDYSLTISWPSTSCNAWDRVVGFNGAQITCRRYDDIPPNPSDLTFTCPVNVLANSALPLIASGNSGGGSLISSIVAKYTDYSNPASTVTNPGGFTIGNPISTFSSTMNASNVDLNRQSYGGRPYALDMTLTDGAGNSYTRNCNFNVYANSTSILASTNGTAPLTSGNIAQGDTASSNIRITDIYGNILIPASGIGRSLSMALRANNAMYLDQRSRGGSSSVLVSDPSNAFSHFPIGPSATASFGSQSSSNGNYPFSFKVYTPTANSYLPADGPISDVSARFTLNGVTVNTSDSIGTASAFSSLGGGVSFVFRPLYVSRITGELKDQGWFIEWSVQQSAIAVDQNGSRNGSASNVELEYNGSDASKFRLYGGTNVWYASTQEITGTPSVISNPVSLPSATTGFYSRLVQNAGAVTSTSRIYLSSHVRYTLDGLDILYNSDIVGKDSYHGTELNLGNQAGLRVIWSSYSKNASTTLDSQFLSEVSIFDNTKDANLIKTQIRKNAYDLIRGAPLGNQTSTNISTMNGTNAYGQNIVLSDNSSVLYFGELGGGNVTIGAAGDLGISGRRTLVVIGGNVYIKGNITYGNPATDTLGIIALTDADGNGGNIYIDPEVVNISATLFAERSALSYNTTFGEIDGWSMASLLKNQLYIYGSLISNNTIGGARIGQCPLFVPLGSCDSQTAQKYDLNYLRRYHLVTSVISTTTIYQYDTGAKTIGGGNCSISGNCSGHIFSTARNFTNVSSGTNYEYARYPVIIDYNAFVNSLPPLGFSMGEN